MAYQDMKNGDGVCVIDAKGDLIPQLIHWAPEHRKDDCILLDLKTPIPIDFMSCKDHDERAALVSDIIQIFKRLDEGWGIRMEALLRYVLHTLLIYGGCCFLDIYQILTSKSFRDSIIESQKIQSNPVLKTFWGERFDKLGKDATTPIVVSRMADFLLSPALSTILGSPNAPLNIAEAMEKRKILLVNLNGATDEAMVYGSLLVSKIQQAAFRRASTPKDERIPFMLYVDEFQNFRPSGFEQILSMAGGLKLCLTIANQYFSQLDTSLQDAIINNVSSYFLFRMAAENVARLKSELKNQLPPNGMTVPAMRERVSQLKSGIKHWDNMIEQEDIYGENLRFINGRIDEFEDEVSFLEKAIEQSTNPSQKFVDLLPQLPVGSCIYRAADGSTAQIKTPPPAPHTSRVGKTSHAGYIRQNTLAQYGTNSTKLSPPCVSAQVRHTEGNDKPEPQAGPAVQIDAGKEPRP